MSKNSKWIVMAVACVLSVMVLAGCSTSDFTEKFVGVASGSAVSGNAGELTYVSGQAVDIEDYDPLQLVKLGEYKGVEVDCTVSDEEVQQQIDELLQANPNIKKIKKGTAKEGDKVNIDYSGKLNGKKFDGGTAEDQEITLGQSNMIEGFDDAIIGMKVGEEKDANLTFPDDYHSEDLAGKDVVFTMKLNYIIEETPATFDNEFVKKNTDYNTVIEYKSGTKKKLQETKISAVPTEAVSKVIESSTLTKTPQTLLLAEKEMMRAEMENSMKNYGMTLEQALQMYGQTMEQFEETLTKQAETMCKQVIVMEAIAKQENIDTSKAAVDAYINGIIKKTSDGEDGSVDKLKESFEAYYGKAMPFDRYMMDSYIYEKVSKLIEENAKVIK